MPHNNVILLILHLKQQIQYPSVVRQLTVKVETEAADGTAPSQTTHTIQDPGVHPEVPL